MHHFPHEKGINDRRNFPIVGSLVCKPYGTARTGKAVLTVCRSIAMFDFVYRLSLVGVAGCQLRTKCFKGFQAFRDTCKVDRLSSTLPMVSRCFGNCEELELEILDDCEKLLNTWFTSSATKCFNQRG